MRIVLMCFYRTCRVRIVFIVVFTWYVEYVLSEMVRNDLIKMYKLTWFNLNPSTKWLHPSKSVGRNYLSIPKLFGKG